MGGGLLRAPWGLLLSVRSLLHAESEEEEEEEEREKKKKGKEKKRINFF
jgi:hypothetical protein